MPRALITNASGQFIRPSCQLAHRLKFLSPLSRSLSLSFTILSRVNAFFDARAVAAAVAAPRGHGTRAYADSGANSIRFVPAEPLIKFASSPTTRRD